MMKRLMTSVAAVIAVSGCGNGNLPGSTTTTSNESRAAQSQALPDGVLQQIADLRKELGLRSDLVYVGTLYRDPASLSAITSGARTGDLTVTAAEQAKLKQRVLLQELAVELAPQAIALAGERFAGVTLDTEPGGDTVLRVRLTGETDEAFEGRLLGAAPTDLRAQVQVAYVQSSLADLRSLQVRLAQQLETNGDAALRIVASEVDERANVVVLFAEGDVAGLQAFVAHSNLASQVRVEAFGQANVNLLGYDKADLLPQGVLEGGLQLDRLRNGVDDGRCSTGFAVRGPNADFVLTAGHCFHQGTQYLQGGKEVGDVAEHVLGPDFDVMLIDTSRARITNGGVHRTSDDWAAAITGVVAADADVPGSIVCQAGPASNGGTGALVAGGRCGVIQSRFHDPGARYSASFRRASYVAEPGDSGAPVWMDRSAGGLAEGLVMGCLAPVSVGVDGATVCEAGGAAPACRCRPGFQLFSHLPTVLNAFELTLNPY